MKLRDGRILGFAEYGEPNGAALFYFHGFPGARIEAEILARPAEHLGFRLIAIDRPGMGLSTFKPQRRFLDWPADVVELADYLGIGRFSIVAYSGGGPYALACASRLAERIEACGIVSGAGMAGPVLRISSPWLSALLAPLMGMCFRNKAAASRSEHKFSRWWPAVDKRADTRGILAASFAEAFRQGAKGPAYEGRLLGGAWDFRPEEVRCLNLHWWHGERDRHVPIRMGRGVAARLSGCTASYYPAEGHISLIANHGEEILKTLAA
ncbi:MAG TPA: alpha/beta hydrolase [Methylovirgula sp.]|nr:alpha/beta hydrolase [Methylovirgula sp.]